MIRNYSQCMINITQQSCENSSDVPCHGIIRRQSNNFMMYCIISVGEIGLYEILLV